MVCGVNVVSFEYQATDDHRRPAAKGFSRLWPPYAAMGNRGKAGSHGKRSKSKSKGKGKGKGGAAGVKKGKLKADPGAKGSRKGNAKPKGGGSKGGGKGGAKGGGKDADKKGQRAFSGLLGGFGDASDVIGDVPNKRDAQLAEVLGFVKKGRMDRALQLAAPLAEAVDAAPAQFLAEQCSERAADARPERHLAAYCNSKEAQEMAVQLVVAGTTFDIPGRDVNLIRPRQLVEGFWLRKVSDVYEMADGGTGELGGGLLFLRL
eukprot:s128_g12.t1